LIAYPIIEIFQRFRNFGPHSRPTSGFDSQGKTFRDFIKNLFGPVTMASPYAKNVKLMILDDNRGNIQEWSDKVSFNEVPEGKD